MKEKLTSTIIVTIALTMLVGIFLNTKALENSDKKDNNVAKISKYKNWTKVNSADPFRQTVANSRDCVPQTIEEETMLLDSEHKDKYITVYVNEIGKRSMFQPIPKFPVGSIIVKEKFSTKNASFPELLTAMVKRHKGFNSKFGDWEFFVLDSSFSDISNGKLHKCQSCHFSIKDKDFVFRTYLSYPSVERNFK